MMKTRFTRSLRAVGAGVAPQVASQTFPALHTLLQYAPSIVCAQYPYKDDREQFRTVRGRSCPLSINVVDASDRH